MARLSRQSSLIKSLGLGPTAFGAAGRERRKMLAPENTRK
jgi:hypothetical protein